MEELVSVSTETLNEGQFEYSSDSSLLGQKITSSTRRAGQTTNPSSSPAPILNRVKIRSAETEPPRATIKTSYLKSGSWRWNVCSVQRLAAFRGSS